MPPPAIHQYVTSARPAPTAAAPMRRTAASARAGRVSTVGTGGAVGIASRVVTSTSRCSPVPAPSRRRLAAADRPSPTEPSTDRAVAVPVARRAAVRTERAAVVAVLARRPCETGGACRVAPGRGVSDRVAPGPTHREQPRRRSGEQPGAAEVAAARRGRSRAAQGNRRQHDRPGPGRVVRGRQGHAVGDGLAVRASCSAGPSSAACALAASSPRPSTAGVPVAGTSPAGTSFSGTDAGVGSQRDPLCRVSSSLTVLLRCLRTGSARLLGGPGERAVRQLWDDSGRRARSPSVLPR